MKINTVTIGELEQKSSRQITEDLRRGDYSLLKSIGCDKLRKEMKKIGIACRTILRLAEIRARRAKKQDYGDALRRSIGEILKNGAPFEVIGKLYWPTKGVVFAFNHPTLGEIIRLIAVCALYYPGRRYLFPVNIAWYEQLAPVAHRMEAFGLYIVPTITPATREKIVNATNNNTRVLELVDKIANGFNADYLASAAEFVNKNDIVLVAPSATRQATIFKTKGEYLGEQEIEPKTMTYIALGMRRHHTSHYVFVPITIIPPEKANRRLNLHKEYKIAFGRKVDAETVQKLVKNRGPRGDKFEYFFLQQIAIKAIELDAGHLIAP